ncbi:MAG TPA: DUF4097 family beta strand repeat-containing protein [Symbiobacteriaceae bacterium]
MKQTQRVGRYTAALTLIAMGTAFLVDTLLGIRSCTRLLLRLWPLMLVSLGVEYLIRIRQARRHPDQEIRFRPDLVAVLLVLLTAFLAAGAAVSPWITDRQVHSISAAGVEELRIDLPVGALEVKPGRAGEIRIEAAPLSFAPLLWDPPDAVALQISQGPVVSVTADGGRLFRSGARLVVSVPPGLKLKATTGAGNIRVTDYQGPMELRADVGTIRVEQFRGSLMAETRTGQIRADTTIPLEGAVHLKTETGQIRLTVPVESSMQVTAETRTGSLRLPDFVKMTREGAGATAQGSTGSGEHPVTLEAVTGSVTMKAR